MFDKSLKRNGGRDVLFPGQEFTKSFEFFVGIKIFSFPLRKPLASEQVFTYVCPSKVSSVSSLSRGQFCNNLFAPKGELGPQG
jgi:hypothetical protein